MAWAPHPWRLERQLWCEVGWVAPSRAVPGALPIGSTCAGGGPGARGARHQTRGGSRAHSTRRRRKCMLVRTSPLPRSRAVSALASTHRWVGRGYSHYAARWAGEGRLSDSGGGLWRRGASSVRARCCGRAVQVCVHSGGGGNTGARRQQRDESSVGDGAACLCNRCALAVRFTHPTHTQNGGGGAGGGGGARRLGRAVTRRGGGAR